VVVSYKKYVQALAMLFTDLFHSYNWSLKGTTIAAKWWIGKCGYCGYMKTCMGNKYSRVREAS